MASKNQNRVAGQHTGSVKVDGKTFRSASKAAEYFLLSKKPAHMKMGASQIARAVGIKPQTVLQAQKSLLKRMEKEIA